MIEKEFKNSEAVRKKQREYQQDWRKKNPDYNKNKMREYRNEKPKDKIKNIKNIINRNKKIFNKRLDEFLSNNPSNIEMMVLKDLMYRVLNEKRFFYLKQEINNSLDELFKKNPYKLSDKQAYNKISENSIVKILNRDKLLTQKQILRVYTHPLWAEAIEKCMYERRYRYIKSEKNGKFIPQTSQK